MGIGKHLIHTVDIVHVTMTRGVRSETITSDVAAYVSERKVVRRNESGDLYEMLRTLIFLAGNTVIAEDDNVIVEGKTRPVVHIHPARTKRTGIHHLEVEVS